MDPSSLRAAEFYDLLFLFAKKKAQIMLKQTNLLDASLRAYYKTVTWVRPKPFFWFK